MRIFILLKIYQCVKNAFTSTHIFYSVQKFLIPTRLLGFIFQSKFMGESILLNFYQCRYSEAYTNILAIIRIFFSQYSNQGETKDLSYANSCT